MITIPDASRAAQLIDVPMPELNDDFEPGQSDQISYEVQVPWGLDVLDWAFAREKAESG
jgi:hypothetical protein